MAEVIRLVCPECDAVHRVKSVTLGKLYRCKKCRSGLITMQPAILVCPNCGATTPPAHIEASKLITCEECEKAPLMEVRLPGVEYPKAVSSDENAKIASVMSEANTANDILSEDEESDSETYAEYGAEVEVVEVPQAFEEQDAAELEQKSEEDALDETSIFKADTNFIVKNKNNTAENSEEDSDSSHQLQQLNIFESNADAEDEVADYDAPESELQDEFDSEEYTDAAELLPEIEVAESSEPLESAEVVSDITSAAFSGEDTQAQSSVETGKTAEKKRGWGWSIPAWIPAVFALLLVALYGMLYADLVSMRIQLEKSQESIILQDQSFQQERKKYLTLIKSTQDENRKLRDSVMELKSENDQLRRKSVVLDVPEIKD